MKNKMNLSSLKVKSFVTKMNESNAKTVNGGSSLVTNEFPICGQGDGTFFVICPVTR